VDREERPDLDRLYQLSHQMLTGRGGGWPLTMFLMHDDQRPFFWRYLFPARGTLRPAGVSRSADAGIQATYHEHSEQLRSPAAQIVRRCRI